MPEYGELRVDYITYTTGTSPSEGKGTVTVSGLINNPTFSGNVIVGNDLTVSGDINASGVTISGITGLFASGTEAAPSISFDGDIDTGFYKPAADKLAISTGGTSRVIIDDSGRVGIGTSAPNYTLDASFGASSLMKAGFDVDDSGNPTLYLNRWQGTSTNYKSAALTCLIDGTITFSNATAGSTALSSQSYSERLRITSDGNVGIGVTDPRVALQVNGDDVTLGGALGTTNSTLDIVSDEDTNNGFTARPGIVFRGPYATGNADRYSHATIFSEKENNGQGNQSSALVFGTNQTGGAGVLEKMRITSDGRVGIGTTDPSTELEVVANNPTITARATANNTSNLALDNTRAANVIGSQILGKWDGNTVSAIRFINGSDGTNSDDGLITFSTSNGSSNPQERLRITQDGNVGIGTTAPNCRISAAFSDTTAYATSLSANSGVENGTEITSYRNTDSSSTNNKYLLQAFSIQGGSGQSNVFGRFGFARTSNSKGAFVWQIRNLNGADINNSQEAMRLTNDGNLGIGTSAPTSILSVVSPNANTTETVAEFGNQTIAGGLQIETNGNLDWGFNARNSRSLTFSTNQAEAVRIDASGRLLVGTSSAITLETAAPSFQVVGDSAASGYGSIVRTNGQARFAIARGSSGNLATSTIGEFSFQGYDGSAYLSAASIEGEVDGTPGANDMPGRLVFSTTASGASSPTERMRISQDGRIRSFSSSATIFEAASSSAAGTTNFIFVGKNAGTAIGTGTSCVFIYSNGDLANNNNAYGAISDIKLKENIVDASSQWDDLKALQVRNYNFKEGQTHTQIGLVAQEVELVSPGLVSETPDRDDEGNDLGTVTKSVNYSVLYMKAVKALQEAMERIETLEQRLTDAGI